MLYNFYLRKLYEKRIIKIFLGGRLESLKSTYYGSEVLSSYILKVHITARGYSGYTA